MTNKASGVYYTPSAVVDYIVRGTLGPLLEGKSPMQLAGRQANWEQDEASHPLTVLDPACGTGYFLVGVYQFLLDWSLRWYCEHDAESWLIGPRPTICRDGQSLCLEADERQRILREHIFGVDIDEQAIEIAKRSLLAKMSGDQCEPEAATACFDNIRCGNSLIGSDFHQHGDQGGLDDPRPVVRTFDWEDEFPAMIASGGFDAIVGNPPYVNARHIKQQQGEAVKRYFRERYRCARRAFDLYVLFVERSHELLRQGGRAGLIVPNKIATLDYARPCREMLLEETTLNTITDVSDQQLFRDASVYPYIITWTKMPPAPDHTVRIVNAVESADLSPAETSHFIRQAAWSAETGIAIHGSLDVESRVTTQPLSQRGSLHSGTTGFSAERTARALREQEATGDGDAFDFIVSGNIGRYVISLGNVRFMKRQFARPVLSIDSDVLTTNKRDLFSHAKIVMAGMCRRLEAAFDGGGLALGVQVYVVANFQDDPRFLLGVLNSTLMSYLLRIRFPAKRLAGGYLAINKSQLAKLPIRSIDEADREAVSMRDGIIDIVGGLERPNAESDRAIDRLVYRLYGLTDDEVEMVQRYPL
ncbi:MAG: N-6 DNA methylase [Planctomycetota bacterium]|nr:N-6 DNA methylase [Planctomycetota bacterium]